MNAAATWSYDLINARGVAMGQEHRGKGIDVQLGPVAGIKSGNNAFDFVSN